MDLQLPVPDFAPSAERIGLAPIWEGLGVVCLGAAAIFLAAIILYFLLRGRKNY